MCQALIPRSNSPVTDHLGGDTAGLGSVVTGSGGSAVYYTLVLVQCKELKNIFVRCHILGTKNYGQ